jgi:hypothetical protein
MKLKIYSHPRSGTNFARALLAATFYQDTSVVEVTTGHWSQRQRVLVPTRLVKGPQSHPFFRTNLPGPRVYLIRDGRDVALSMWRTKHFQCAAQRELSLSDYLSAPLDWYRDPGHRSGRGMTIVEHWKAHVDSWYAAPDTYFLRYEQLLENRAAELARLGAWLGKDVLPCGEIGSVGPWGSGDHKIEKWRDMYTTADLNYFHSVVPPTYWGLYNPSFTGEDYAR